MAFPSLPCVFPSLVTSSTVCATAKKGLQRQSVVDYICISPQLGEWVPRILHGEETVERTKTVSTEHSHTSATTNATAAAPAHTPAFTFPAPLPGSCCRALGPAAPASLVGLAPPVDDEEEVGKRPAASSHAVRRELGLSRGVEDDDGEGDATLAVANEAVELPEEAERVL